MKADMTNRKSLLKYVGRACRRWRLYMGYKAAQVAEETGYCENSISIFESGKNNNAVIFLWYVAHGFDVENDFIGHKLSRTSACDLFQEFLKGE